jgi:hypothetical protein
MKLRLAAGLTLGCFTFALALHSHSQTISDEGRVLS